MAHDFDLLGIISFYFLFAYNTTYKQHVLLLLLLTTNDNVHILSLIHNE